MVASCRSTASAALPQSRGLPSQASPPLQPCTAGSSLPQPRPVQACPPVGDGDPAQCAAALAVMVPVQARPAAAVWRDAVLAVPAGPGKTSREPNKHLGVSGRCSTGCAVHAALQVLPAQCRTGHGARRRTSRSTARRWLRRSRRSRGSRGGSLHGAGQEQREGSRARVNQTEVRPAPPPNTCPSYSLGRRHCPPCSNRSKTGPAIVESEARHGAVASREVVSQGSRNFNEATGRPWERLCWVLPKQACKDSAAS